MKSFIRTFTLIASSDEPGAEPPRDIRIFAWGVNKAIQVTREGPVEVDVMLDKAGADQMIARFAAHGNDLVIDYDHHTLEPVTNGPSPAAGWIPKGGLQTRADGLWAVGIRWIAEAAELIRTKKYRYFSPTFLPDDKGRAVLMMPLAITNYPALVGIQPLAAKAVTNSKKRTGRAMAGTNYYALVEALEAAVAEKFGEGAEITSVDDKTVSMTIDGKAMSVGYSYDGTAVTFDGEPTEMAAAVVPPADAEDPKKKPVAARAATRAPVTRAEFAALQAQFENRDAVELMITTLRAEERWTPAREKQLRETAKVSLSIAQSTAKLFEKVPQLAGGNHGDPPVTGQKKWSQLSITERHELHNSDYESYCALREEHKRETRLRAV